MKVRRIISILLVAVLLICSFSFVVSAFDGDIASSGATYANKTKYESEAAKAANVTDLGCTYTPEKTQWKLWSVPATAVSLKLYKTGTDAESGASVLGVHKMTKTETYGIWSITLVGDYKDIYYTYIITIGNDVKETQDPYATAVGANGDRSMVCDLAATDPEGWDKDQHVFFDTPNQAVVWELHVRDFSINATSGVKDEYKGKFMAFTQGDTKINGSGDVSTCVDYLVEHNINCVQLMPIADFASIDETSGAVQRNWGYDSKNYNVPEGSYSTNPYDGNNRITEFKMLVQALHDRGIAVVMDVVYNHTFVLEGSALSISCPQYYYRMSSDTDYCDGSGLGNVLASDKKMCQKYISNSLQYWVNEYHVDGFRFDLMGCIDVESMKVFRSDLDKISSKILMWGEPWIGGSNNGEGVNGINNGNLKDCGSRVGAFNEKYADDLKGNHESATSTYPKGFVQGNTSCGAEVKNAANGTSTYLTGSAASQLVNYVDNHDNLCLFDQIMSSNGLYSAGKDDKNLYNKNLAKSNSTQYNNQVKLGLASCITSQGIPFTLAGDEMCRTKYGDANSYRTPDNMNSIDWTRAQTYSDVADFYKGLTAIRQAYSGFTQANKKSTTAISGCPVAYQITNSKSGEWNKVVVALNNTSGAKTISVSGSWVVVCNGQKAGVTSLGTCSGSYSVPAYSAVILVDSASFNNYTPPAFGTMKLKVEHYLRDSESESYTLADSQTATYRDGMTYRASEKLDYLFDHDFDRFDSTSGGTYGTAKAGQNVTVKFYYTRNIATNYLNVTFVDSSNNQQIRTPMKYRLKDGAPFSVPSAVIQGYSLDTDKYPGGTKGTFDASQPINIQFAYKSIGVNTTKVHYYKRYSQWTGTVLAYAYYTDANGDLVEPIGKWIDPKSKVGMQSDSSMGANWYVKDIPCAQCYVMFHPSATSGSGAKSQEPGVGEQGYNVSGEAWIKDGVVTFNCKLVTSFIDLETGKKLKDDIVKDCEKVSSSQQYTTSPDRSLGQYITPPNASGFYTAGTTNVVYLYTKDTPPPVGDDVYGDVDGDKEVTIIDATVIQKYLAKLITFDDNQMIAADVNADNDVSIVDPLVIQKYLANVLKPSDNSRVNEKIGGGGSGHTHDEFAEKYDELSVELPKYPKSQYKENTDYIFAQTTLDNYQLTRINPAASAEECEAGYQACVKALDGLKKLEPGTEPTTEPVTYPPTPSSGYVYLSIEQFPDWAAAGCKFAVYFFNYDESYQWVQMELKSKNLYKAEIPEGFSNCIFTRINPAYADLSWDAVWTQTEDLDIQDGGTFYITGWGDPNSQGYWD